MLPGLRSPPLCAGQPRRRDESRAESCEGTLALAALWPSPTCGMAAAAASGPGPGEKSQHTERAATLATGLRGLFPVLSLLGRLVETRCSCRRGGPPALFHRETRRLCGRRARGPAARPASLRKGRISTRPGRPLSSSGFVASIPKAAAISFDASNQLWMRSRDGVVHHTRADAEADNEHFNGLAHHRPPRLFRTAVDEWKDARTRVTGRYPDHRALP